MDIDHNIHQPLPAMEPSSAEEIRPMIWPDLILNPNPYHPETRDEDFRHCRLPEATMVDQDDRWLVKADQNLEPLLFPWLFPYGHGQWCQPTIHEPERFYHDTLGRDVKRRLNSIISHFRDDHYWPAWSYMRIEERRIFQNNNRLVSAQKRKQLNGRIRTSDLLAQSQYGPWPILNEEITQSIPASIRTGDTYFLQAEAKVNSMIKARENPTLFLTLTFSEAWQHYRLILANQGCQDTLPSNRPWDAVNYYYERWLNLKRHFLRKPQISGYGTLQEMIKRHEFQLRAAIHTHSLLWTQRTIDELIAEDYIRAD